MLNSDYTKNTIYDFKSSCCRDLESMNIVGVAPRNRLERALSINAVDSNKWVQFFVPEIVDIPVQKPDIEGIVEVSSCIEIISQRVVRTPTVIGFTDASGVFIPGTEIDNAECTNLTGRKLIIEGILKQKVVYTALVPDQALHSASFIAPFSAFIIVEADTPLTRIYRISALIEDIFACRLSDRSIFKNTTIFINASQVC
jgi:hypothetical protein